METITISVDSEVKTAFERATPETLQKLTTLLNLLFKDQQKEQTLTEVMAEIADKAQTRGLTPEILELILTD
ncbi:MAG: hypothetical protein DCF12_11080 [Snowella sp.]|nr:MAG: hypothetical protein DCF12_11080 [Snowella sp.]